MEMPYRSINPYTLEIIAEYPFIDDISLIIERAKSGYEDISTTSIDERKKRLLKLGSLIIENREDLAVTISKEMGKPITDARGEVTKSASLCEYLGNYGDTALKERTLENGSVRISFDPIGIVLAISPWNFPLWLPLRSALPAVLAGNSVIFKPAPNTAGTALKLGELIKEVFGDTVIQVVLARNEQIKTILENRLVDCLTFTGSVNTGGYLASLAGKSIIKQILELGGNDPCLILSDADLDLASKVSFSSRFRNCGQVCCATKRFIIEESVYDDFKERLISLIKTIKFGDPLAEDTLAGPLAREDIKARYEEQISRLKQLGARLLQKHEHNIGTGYFVDAFAFELDNSLATEFDEEVFGPCAILFRVKDREEALRLANSSSFGLGASIFTKDIEGIKPLIHKINAGTVSINGIVTSYPAVPFGGVKRSGYGRELGEFGIREFTNVRSVIVNERGCK